MKCPVCGAAELIHDTRDVPSRVRHQNADFAFLAKPRPYESPNIYELGRSAGGSRNFRRRHQCLFALRERQDQA